MPLKRVVLIIMCALLLLTVVLGTVIAGKIAPIFGALLGGNPSTTPNTSLPSTSTTQKVPVQTTTVPTQSTTQATQPTTLPTTQPTTVPPATGHQHAFALTHVEEPTCEIAGYSVYTCDCGEVEMRDAVEPTGHSFGPGQKVVFCTEPGYTEYTCVNCGQTDRQNITDPLGHDNYLVEQQEHTCTQDGYELYRCLRCNAETKENEQIATGHTDFDWVQIVAPGVGVAGEEFRQCTTCMESESRPCLLEITSRQELQGQEDLQGYIIFVGTKTTPRALRYIVNDYSFAPDLYTVYSEEGLLVSYTDKNGKSQTTVLPALEEVVLNIDTEGKIVEGPYPPTNPSQPTQPTTQPTQPTTQPTEPSQPTTPTE